MKLKYYLRGLGIGIICTAIIMGIALSGNKKETMTDTEIIERARLLGMVMPEDADEDALADGEKQTADDKDPQPETGDKNTEDKSGSKAGDDKKEDSQAKEAKALDGNKEDDKTVKQETDKKQDSQQDKNQSGNKAGDSQKTDTNAANDNAAQQPSTQEMVEIEIKAGDYSAAVSQTLLRAGLISDADAFNKYLTQKGVDQNLRVGVYQIPKGSTQDQIIEILQKKE